MADGSVVFGRRSEDGWGGDAGSAVQRLAVQRAADDTPSPQPEYAPEPPDPEPESATPPDEVPGAYGTFTAPTATAPRSGSADGTGPPAVTDDLVRALYTPLSRLLKADLRLERERAGRSIDTRH
jgi:hypothetical protein